jgi:hypothetical protein
MEGLAAYYLIVDAWNRSLTCCLLDEFLFHEIYAEDEEDYSDNADPDYAQKQCCLSAEA